MYITKPRKLIVFIWTFPNVLACICEHAKIWAIFCFLFFRNVVKVTLFLHCLSLDVAPWSAPRRHAGSFSVRAPTFWKRARRPVQRPRLGEGARRPAGYYRVPKKLHQPDADTQRITGKETSPQNTTAAQRVKTIKVSSTRCGLFVTSKSVKGLYGIGILFKITTTALKYKKALFWICLNLCVWFTADVRQCRLAWRAPGCSSAGVYKGAQRAEECPLQPAGPAGHQWRHHSPESAGAETGWAGL